MLLRLAVALGRNEGPVLLENWWFEDALTRDQLREVLPDIWNGAEFPERTLEPELWIELFRAAEFAPPSQPVLVFRGATPERRDGLAWTTDVDVARWFARRAALLSVEATVYRTAVTPEAVLCDMQRYDPEGRDEHEMVVDTAMLGRIDVHESVPRASG